MFFDYEITPAIDPISPRLAKNSHVWTFFAVNVEGVEHTIRHNSRVKYFKDVYVQPLYILDHSGLQLSHQPFYGEERDSYLCGYAMCKKKVGNRKKCLGLLEEEIEEFNQWLIGDVWDVSIILQATGEEVASRKNIYGWDYAEDTAEGLYDEVEEEFNDAMNSNSEVDA